MNMIDIHSHILPGVDDGAKDEQASIDMAKAAINEGITHIVASPHHKNGVFDNYRDEIQMQVTVLNDLYKMNDIDLTVIPGQEVRIYGEVVEDLKNGALQTINESKYMLIVFTSARVTRYTDLVLYDMHIERI